MARQRAWLAPLWLAQQGIANRKAMGRAGEHQVAGARTALGHAYGGGSQFFSLWLVADTPD